MQFCFIKRYCAKYRKRAFQSRYSLYEINENNGNKHYRSITGVREKLILSFSKDAIN